MKHLKIKPGDLIQIWDWRYEEHWKDQVHTNLRLTGHGDLGYVVGFGKDNKDTEESIVRVICFGKESNVGVITHVNADWIRKIEKSSDVLRPSDE